MHTLVLRLFVPATLAGALSAQAGNDLVVTPSKENVVASRLVGTWRLDAELNRRVGGTGTGDALEFRSDDTVVAGIPRKLADKLKEHRIYLAGTMVLRGKEQPFLLIAMNGNPHIVWFRERDGDAMGDAESFNVMLARGADPEKDLLFTGGDKNNQSFTPYMRVKAGAGAAATDVQAAIADMIRLLSAKQYVEFIKAYASPDDLKRIQERGESVEQLAAQFGESKSGKLLAMLKAAEAVVPTFNPTETEATFAGLDDNRELRLQRVDARWYLRN